MSDDTRSVLRDGTVLGEGETQGETQEVGAGRAIAAAVPGLLPHGSCKAHAASSAGRGRLLPAPQKYQESINKPSHLIHLCPRRMQASLTLQGT